MTLAHILTCVLEISGLKRRTRLPRCSLLDVPAQVRGQRANRFVDPVGLKILWFSTTTIALLHIRRRKIKAHREWMIRSFSLSLFFVTFSLWVPGLASTNLPEGALSVGSILELEPQPICRRIMDPPYPVAVFRPHVFQKFYLVTQ